MTTYSRANVTKERAICTVRLGQITQKLRRINAARAITTQERREAIQTLMRERDELEAELGAIEKSKAWQEVIEA